MGKSVNCVVRGGEVFKNLREFLGSPEPMKKIVNDVTEGIIKKTAGGYDYMGRNFKPYSKAYAKKKGKSRPDLRVSGRMLDSIKGEVISPRHGRVDVTDMELIAYFHNCGSPGGKIPKREFMNLSQNAKEALLKKYIDDEIMKILGRK